MSWAGPKDLKAQVNRLWERGDLLREAVSGETQFPLRLRLKTPASADITERFEAVRAWAAELAAEPAVQLAWQEVRHRVQGTQRLPAAATVETLDKALAWIGKRREWEMFANLVAETRRTFPALLPWLARRPLDALALADVWPRLLAVVAWVRDNPRAGIYLRQVDVPGVHTKFIETHRAVLAELLDLVLPPDAIDAGKSGTSQFAARYGFRDKPVRIRFRVLDPGVCLLPGPECPDVTLDAESFSRLDPGVGRVFLTENEINFLAFPRLADAIVIFGGGYGWRALGQAGWLRQCAMCYWGDIDTHGFGILDALREQFDHVTSFLMDRATLDAHAAVWGTEDKPLRIDLHRLTPDERALYDDLRDNRIRPGLRLEQERIGFGWLADRLGEIG